MYSPRKIGELSPEVLNGAFNQFGECVDSVIGRDSNELLRSLLDDGIPSDELVYVIQTLESLAIQDLDDNIRIFALAFNTKSVTPGKFQNRGWHEDDRPDDSWGISVADKLPTDFLNAGLDEIDLETLENINDTDLEHSKLFLRFSPGDIVRFGGNVIHRSGINMTKSPIQRTWVGLSANFV